MNGFKARRLLAGLFAAGVVSVTGCCDYCYDDLVDPCYPQRYICQARASVYTPLATQASNGLVLEQTVWNYHFATVKDGDKAKVVLTPGGMEHLNYLVRRRPCPVPEVYLQTAHDVLYNPEKPEQFVVDRTELDSLRIRAVTDYLAAARPDVPFKVLVHDPHPVGIHAIEAANSVRHMHQTSQGAIPAESFGDGVPINGITGNGADPTGRGEASVTAAGATRLQFTNTEQGVTGAAAPATSGPSGSTTPAGSTAPAGSQP